MTTITVLPSGCNIEPNPNMHRPLNKEEHRVYKNLKSSFEEIKLHQEGKIELRDAGALLGEL